MRESQDAQRFKQASAKQFFGLLLVTALLCSALCCLSTYPGRTPKKHPDQSYAFLEVSSRSGLVWCIIILRGIGFGGAKANSDVACRDFVGPLHVQARLCWCPTAAHDAMSGIRPTCHRVPELSGRHSFVVAGDFKGSQHLPEANTLRLQPSRLREQNVDMS